MSLKISTGWQSRERLGTEWQARTGKVTNQQGDTIIFERISLDTAPILDLGHRRPIPPRGEAHLYALC